LPSGPVVPATHLHESFSVLALGDNVFIGHTKHVVWLVDCNVVEYVLIVQFVHNALPVTCLYVPAAQGVHS
jgi:hypothetical protein